VSLNAAQYATPAGGDRFFLTDEPILGANPPPPPGGIQNRPPLRADVPCETQEQPDLRTNPMQMADKSFRIAPSDPVEAAKRELKARRIAVTWLRDQYKRQGRDLEVTDDLLGRVDVSKIEAVTK
jgi:hypothetical protein